MIHEQQDQWVEPVRAYAWCVCGVCGPLRRSREAADADEAAHQVVCSSSPVKAAA